MRPPRNRMCQQRAAPLRGVPDTQGHPAEPGEQPRLEGVLEEDREVGALPTESPGHAEERGPAFLGRR